MPMYGQTRMPIKYPLFPFPPLDSILLLAYILYGINMENIENERMQTECSIRCQKWNSHIELILL